MEGDREQELQDALRRLAELERNFEYQKEETAKQLDYLHVAPPKLKDGMIVIADGTDWNPGSGQGVYVYFNAVWNKL